MVDPDVSISLVKQIARLSANAFGVEASIPWRRNEDDRVNAREAQLELLEKLTNADIDPHLFDLMLSSEQDRILKKQFGVAFLAATIIFTMASYAVIILNSVHKWGISDIAITSLIVETPIQFIGLLYIIARNLFPQQTLAHSEGSNGVKRLQKTPRNVPRRLPKTAKG